MSICKSSKIFFLICLLMASIFCMPKNTEATTVELAVTLNSITIPQRSAMAGYPESSPHALLSSRFVVSYGGTPGTIVGYANPLASGYNGRMDPGTTTRFGFNYIAANAPYTVSIEIQVAPQGTSAVCKSDCSRVEAGSNWYYVVGDGYYAFGGYSIVCPNWPCYKNLITHEDAITSTWHGLGVPPNNVYYESWSDDYYWRLPAIYTIDETNI